MTWFIIDDGMYDNPRVAELSLAAVGLWAKTGSWLGRQSRDDGFDGLITPVRVRRLGGTARLARELVDAGLWQATEGGWLVDWIDGVCVKPRERTREERERLSAVRAEAGRAGGRASGAARRSKRDARTKQTPTDGRSKREATCFTTAKQTAGKTKPYTDTYTDGYLPLTPPDAETEARTDAVADSRADTHAGSGAIAIADAPTGAVAGVGSDAHAPSDAGRDAGSTATAVDADAIPADPASGFDAAWDRYPAHTGSRERALAAWTALRVGGEPMGRLYAAVLAYRRAFEHGTVARRHTPSMGRWLSSGAWRDWTPTSERPRRYEWGGISREWIDRHIVGLVPDGAFTDAYERDFWASVKTGTPPDRAAGDIVGQINARNTNRTGVRTNGNGGTR